MQSLRRELSRKFGFVRDIRIGLAGGIGTPEAAAAAFIMGEDFDFDGVDQPMHGGSRDERIRKGFAPGDRRS